MRGGGAGAEIVIAIFSVAIGRGSSVPRLRCGCYICLGESWAGGALEKRGRTKFGRFRKWKAEMNQADENTEPFLLSVQLLDSNLRPRNWI